MLSSVIDSLVGLSSRNFKVIRKGSWYYGWTSNDPWAKRTSIDKRMDEMFVVLGRDLIQRIAAGTYCGKIKCDIANQLVDANYGGTSLGVWLLFHFLIRYPDVIGSLN
jgi:hypothetical protein